MCLQRNGIDWWKTLPESADLNLIENVWHELKEFIHHEVKSTTKAGLVEDKLQFWRTVDTVKCRKYNRILEESYAQVIEVEGEASGY